MRYNYREGIDPRAHIYELHGLDILIKLIFRDAY